MFNITGSLFIRGTTREAPDGRQVVMVVGVIALPNDVKLPLEHQVALRGYALDDDTLDLFVSTDKKNRVDHTKAAYGKRIDQLLTSPMWRV